MSLHSDHYYLLRVRNSEKDTDLLQILFFKVKFIDCTGATKEIKR